MPDTEAQTEQIAAPEATAPAAPPEEPARKSKMTDGQRIAAAAAELSKIEKRPFDPAKAPAKDAPAEAETADAEKPADEQPQQPEKVTSAEWREYRKRLTKLEKKEQAFTARESRVADIEKQVEAWESDKKLLLADPKAFWAKVAKEAGSSYAEQYARFADAYLDEGKPDAKLDAALSRIEELSKKLADAEDKTKKDAAAEQERAVFGAFLRTALADEFKNTTLTFRRHGERTVIEDATAVTRMLYEKLGRGPSDAEIARELDLQYGRYYKEIVDSHSGLSQPPQGVAERVNGAEKSAKPVAPQAPKTLTNGGSAERAAPARKLTERERIEAATKLLPG